jgi:hypothetical protein
MNKIAEELNLKLNSLDQARADKLTKMVRIALVAIDLKAPIDPMLGVENGWPVGYFASTMGSFADEPLERVQGTMQTRDNW